MHEDQLVNIQPRGRIDVKSRMHAVTTNAKSRRASCNPRKLSLTFKFPGSKLWELLAFLCFWQSLNIARARVSIGLSSNAVADSLQWKAATITKIGRLSSPTFWRKTSPNRWLSKEKLRRGRELLNNTCMNYRAELELVPLKRVY